jgi:hypothetical protein
MDKTINSDKLNRYYVLLNRHFGKNMSVRTRFVDVPGIDSKINSTQEVISITTNRSNSIAEVEKDLIKRIKMFFRKNLTDNIPGTKTLFWRVIPSVREGFDHLTKSTFYYGKTRIVI